MLCTVWTIHSDSIRLELLPSTSHPMDILRTGCSAIGILVPEPRNAGLQFYQHHLIMRTSAFSCFFCRKSIDRCDTVLAIKFIWSIDGSFKNTELITVRLMSLFSSMLCYWYHFHNSSTRIDTSGLNESVIIITNSGIDPPRFIDPSFLLRNRLPIISFVYYIKKNRFRLMLKPSMSHWFYMPYWSSFFSFIV